jgi:parallel beta-helix repeat protein
VEIVHGHLILEECRITSESPWCVVAIHEPTANPQLLRCLVHGGHDVAIYVYGRARGRLHECTVRDSGTGVVVSEGSHVIVQDCLVEGMRDAGVQFYKKGRGVVEGCTISHNNGHGIDIDQSAGPIIRACRINRNGGSAIRLGAGAGGTVEDCDLGDNRRGAWNTMIRLRVTERGNTH